MIVMCTMDKLMPKVRCMELGTCFLKMASAIKECSIRVLEMVWDLPLIFLVISTKESIVKVFVKVKAYLKLMMAKFMKEVGVIIKCMAEVERPSRMENALLCITKMATN